MRKTQYSSVCDINITNLVDVMMMLLVIFMLTAPFIQAGIKVQLPRAKSTVIKEQEGVIVSIRQDGEVFLGNMRVDRGRLAEEFMKLKVSGEERVFIRADKAVQYGVVMDVIGNIKEVGIDEVGMITEKK